MIKLINSLLKVKYPFFYMILGEVFNPRDWKANTMGGLVCASISCRIDLQINVLNVQTIIAMNI
ncbi:MAG TPA: hypothetical protein VFR65_05645 [Nitrososphaeraceae archaeon]|nr:hypothetical protein [Nitrososphaeraceae archaeon]